MAEGSEYRNYMCALVFPDKSKGYLRDFSKRKQGQLHKPHLRWFAPDYIIIVSIL